MKVSVSTVLWKKQNWGDEWKIQTIVGSIVSYSAYSYDEKTAKEKTIKLRNTLRNFTKGSKK